jgi:hypothetical protein
LQRFGKKTDTLLSAFGRSHNFVFCIKSEMARVDPRLSASKPEAGKFARDSLNQPVFGTILSFYVNARRKRAAQA